ncbi:MAG: MaoC family dehydratase [Deltaproteobacteria bacterium]|nr:MaoC family dehydratase [Deltaproteobacteria bacterium]
MSVIFESPHDLKDAVGKHLGYSEWLTMEQNRVNQFADATGDHQWIHVDVERAKAGPFGAPIAHGYLTLSLVSSFLSQIVEVHGFEFAVNYGTNKVRFPAPVKVGSRIRGGAEVISVEEAKGGIQSIVRVTVEVEGEERPACIAETVSLYFPKKG